MTGASLLDVRGLSVEFDSRDGVARVLNDVSLHVRAGETLAVLGESGCGKSVTAMAVMGILPKPAARVTAGEILFEGRNLLALDEAERRELRGRGIAMIFQDALSALNPVFPVGWQIAEALRVRTGLSKTDADARAVELMDRVRIPAARDRARDYPHQFSGGMRQRVTIAMALALGPKVLIADEPTTALDVTVQAQILELLADLRRQTGMALLLITHDLGVVAGVADRIAVMYAGHVVEHADVHGLFRAPAHPYTRALLDSVPRPGTREPLRAIGGLPPSLLELPAGCAFRPRCTIAVPQCASVSPPDAPLGKGRTSACHLAAEVLDGRV